MKKWNLTEINYIKQNYLTNGSNHCANKLGRPIGSVYHKAERLGIKRPVKKIDMVKFDNIVLPKIAYILGILWADGGISKNGYTVTLTLVEDDMNNIRDILCGCGEWSFYKRKKAKNKHWKPILLARTCNKEFGKFLENNDFRSKRRTSPTKLLSKIPKSLHSYFWRGFLDGDGCIYVQKNKRWKFGTITFAGTYEQSWNDLIKVYKELGIYSKLTRIINKKGHKCSKLVVSNLEDIIKFGELIYNNRSKDKIGLNRKHKKYKTLLKYYNNRTK